MKIHVPANFVGYGTFALSAMVALAYLLKTESPKALWTGLVGLPAVFIALPLLGFAVFGDLARLHGLGGQGGADDWRLVGGVRADDPGAFVDQSPHAGPEVADDVMYKAIALGFAFFTIATILGAFWAAEAWGGYWSWDPKETWALIVWLNYAAWLHMRLMKGLRGVFAAWWAWWAWWSPLCLPGREHVPVGLALLRSALIGKSWVLGLNGAQAAAAWVDNRSSPC